MVTIPDIEPFSRSMTLRKLSFIYVAVSSLFFGGKEEEGEKGSELASRPTKA